MTQFLSPSKLKSFRLCPHRHKNEKYVESDATKFGNAVHAGIAEYLRGGEFLTGYAAEALKRGVPADQQGRAIECFNRVVESPRVAIDRENVLAVESEGDMIPREYREVFDFKGEGKKSFVKVEMVGGQWGLRGAMDLVDVRPDGTLRILDWKSGYGEEIDDLQLACYALAAWKLFPGFTRIETAFFYMDRGAYVPSPIWTEETLVGALEAVDHLAVAYLNEKEWAPKLNKYCPYCTLKANCKAYSQSIVQTPDRPSWDIDATVENFPEILKRIEKIEAISKISYGILETLKEKRAAVLKTAGGTIKVGDHVWKGKEQAQSYEYDIGLIFTKAEELLGRPPFEILKLDSGAFDDLAKAQSDKVVKKALNKLKKDGAKLKSSVYKVSSAIAQEAPAEAEETDDAAADPTAAAKAPAIEDAQIVKPAETPAAEAPATDEPKRAAPTPGFTHYVSQCCGAIRVSDVLVMECRDCEKRGQVTPCCSIETARGVAREVRERLGLPVDGAMAKAPIPATSTKASSSLAPQTSDQTSAVCLNCGHVQPHNPECSDCDECAITAMSGPMFYAEAVRQSKDVKISQQEKCA